MYQKETRAIEITVKPFYLEEQSEPDDSHFVFAYHIRIQNNGGDVSRSPLLNRYWQITDGLGRIQEVRGPGVVGGAAGCCGPARPSSTPAAARSTLDRHHGGQLRDGNTGRRALRCGYSGILARHAGRARAAELRPPGRRHADPSTERRRDCRAAASKHRSPGPEPDEETACGRQPARAVSGADDNTPRGAGARTDERRGRAGGARAASLDRRQPRAGGAARYAQAGRARLRGVFQGLRARTPTRSWPHVRGDQRLRPRWSCSATSISARTASTTWRRSSAAPTSAICRTTAWSESASSRGGRRLRPPPADTGEAHCRDRGCQSSRSCSRVASVS